MSINVSNICSKGFVNASSFEHIYGENQLTNEGKNNVRKVRICCEALGAMNDRVSDVRYRACKNLKNRELACGFVKFFASLLPNTRIFAVLLSVGFCVSLQIQRIGLVGEVFG